MKFKPGDILYYVNPFVFTIEKVMIQIPFVEFDKQYYIDNVGASLAEWDLFEDLPAAKGHAMMFLNKFIEKSQHQIWNANPELQLEEDD